MTVGRGYTEEADKLLELPGIRPAVDHRVSSNYVPTHLAHKPVP